MVAFCTKFFTLEAKPSWSDLSKEIQRKGESIVTYENRFREKALDCHEIIPEKELINLCVNGMQTKYRVHIKIHIILNYAELMVKSKED